MASSMASSSLPAFPSPESSLPSSTPLLLDCVCACKMQRKRKADTVILFIQYNMIHQNKEYNTRHVHAVGKWEYYTKLRDENQHNKHNIRTCAAECRQDDILSDKIVCAKSAHSQPP
jgi:hypothetical protein